MADMTDEIFAQHMMKIVVVTKFMLRNSFKADFIRLVYIVFVIETCITGKIGYNICRIVNEQV